ncbi:hypothetical protein DFH08DRAFT_816986 [Mycena albidolilacea]|uniref:Uncharacterized protein n=1 Tax=Mycena albidolilacea TaxID=1033008 RepID=A0AAD6ZKI9_9AGAR|nr:hypothetical protein DFH08DRAFT_816986 [Mycena albidolilacea]
MNISEPKGTKWRCVGKWQGKKIWHIMNRLAGVSATPATRTRHYQIAPGLPGNFCFADAAGDSDNEFRERMGTSLTGIKPSVLRRAPTGVRSTPVTVKKTGQDGTGNFDPYPYRNRPLQAVCQTGPARRRTEPVKTHLKTGVISPENLANGTVPLFDSPSDPKSPEIKIYVSFTQRNAAGTTAQHAVGTSMAAASFSVFVIAASKCLLIFVSVQHRKDDSAFVVITGDVPTGAETQKSANISAEL